MAVWWSRPLERLGVRDARAFVFGIGAGYIDGIKLSSGGYIYYIHSRSSEFPGKSHRIVLSDSSRSMFDGAETIHDRKIITDF